MGELQRTGKRISEHFKIPTWNTTGMKSFFCFLVILVQLSFQRGLAFTTSRKKLMHACCPVFRDNSKIVSCMPEEALWSSTTTFLAKRWSQDGDNDTRPSKYDPSPLSQQFPPSARTQGVRQSINLLAVAVSLFFVLTWVASGGRLLTPGTTLSTTTSSTTRVLIDADELLRQDFERVANRDSLEI